MRILHLSFNAMNTQSCVTRSTPGIAFLLLLFFVGWLVDVTLKISTDICVYLVGSYEVMQTHSLSPELRFLLLLFFDYWLVGVTLKISTSIYLIGLYEVMQKHRFFLLNYAFRVSFFLFFFFVLYLKCRHISHRVI